MLVKRDVAQLKDKFRHLQNRVSELEDVLKISASNSLRGDNYLYCPQTTLRNVIYKILSHLNLELFYEEPDKQAGFVLKPKLEAKKKK